MIKPFEFLLWKVIFQEHPKKTFQESTIRFPELQPSDFFRNSAWDSSRFSPRIPPYKFTQEFHRWFLVTSQIAPGVSHCCSSRSFIWDFSTYDFFRSVTWYFQKFFLRLLEQLNLGLLQKLHLRFLHEFQLQFLLQYHLKLLQKFNLNFN